MLYDASAASAQRLYDVGTRTIHQLGAGASAVSLAIDTGLARWSEWQLAFAPCRRFFGVGPRLGHVGRPAATL